MIDMKLRVKLGMQGNSYRLTLPLEIVEALKLKSGDIIELDVKDGGFFGNKKEEIKDE